MVGRGITVGRPLGLLLTRRSENATVTLCHTGTRDLAAHVRTADIVVAAAGVPGIITADMVKPGAAVLDVGVSRVDGKIAGDVDPDVWDVAGWVSPNPGGRRTDDPRDAAHQHRARSPRRPSGADHVADADRPDAARRARAEPPESVGRRCSRRTPPSREDPDEPRRYPSTIGGAFYLLVLGVVGGRWSSSSLGELAHSASG